MRKKKVLEKENLLLLVSPKIFLLKKNQMIRKKINMKVKDRKLEQKENPKFINQHKID